MRLQAWRGGGGGMQHLRTPLQLVSVPGPPPSCDPRVLSVALQLPDMVEPRCRGVLSGPKQGGKKIALRGGGGHGGPFSQPPPSLAAMTGGGVQGGGARPAGPWGGGSTQHLWLKMIPTSR